MENKNNGTEKMGELAEHLKKPFDLSIVRKPDIHYYHMQTQFIHMGFDGKRIDTKTYLVKLRCNPAALSGKKFDQYICREFGLQFDSDDIATIPALKNWEYEFNPMSGINGEGPVFGIAHDTFENIKDDKGNELPPDICYAIYNNFIDFHVFNDVFSRPMFGKGIDGLKLIGDKILHPAAFSEAPINLGFTIKPGSVFHNGEITLEFKGISIVNGKLCALIGYDSGESTLNMIIAYSNGEDVTTVGGSEYKGDIYVDLESGWVRKTTLDEFVITKAAEKPSYTVRHLLLRLTDKEDFEKEFAAKEQNL